MILQVVFIFAIRGLAQFAMLEIGTYLDQADDRHTENLGFLSAIERRI
jgi:hypothetical protein